MPFESGYVRGQIELALHHAAALSGQSCGQGAIVPQALQRIGQGVSVGECTGGVERYEVTAPAQGRAQSGEEPAHAEANAIVRGRGVVGDSPGWTRAVELILQP